MMYGLLSSQDFDKLVDAYHVDAGTPVLTPEGMSVALRTTIKIKKILFYFVLCSLIHTFAGTYGTKTYQTGENGGLRTVARRDGPSAGGVSVGP